MTPNPDHQRELALARLTGRLSAYRITLKSIETWGNRPDFSLEDSLATLITGLEGKIAKVQNNEPVDFDED